MTKRLAEEQFLPNEEHASPLTKCSVGALTVIITHLPLPAIAKLICTCKTVATHGQKLRHIAVAKRQRCRKIDFMRRTTITYDPLPYEDIKAYLRTKSREELIRMIPQYRVKDKDDDYIQITDPSIDVLVEVLMITNRQNYIIPAYWYAVDRLPDGTLQDRYDQAIGKLATSTVAYLRTQEISQAVWMVSYMQGTGQFTLNMYTEALAGSYTLLFEYPRKRYNDNMIYGKNIVDLCWYGRCDGDECIVFTGRWTALELSDNELCDLLKKWMRNPGITFRACNAAATPLWSLFSNEDDLLAYEKAVYDYVDASPSGGLDAIRQLRAQAKAKNTAKSE